VASGDRSADRDTALTFAALITALAAAVAAAVWDAVAGGAAFLAVDLGARAGVLRAGVGAAGVCEEHTRVIARVSCGRLVGGVEARKGCSQRTAPPIEVRDRREGVADAKSSSPTRFGWERDGTERDK
jgi:hypothetical protein